MIRNFALFGFFVGLSACGGAQPAAPSEVSSQPIAWRSWGPEVFAEAAATGRMVFVNGSIEGCMACRWMEATSYEHPEVRRRLAESFIAVTIDADAEPAVGQRFERWGWPALVFLNAEGRVLHAIRGNKQPLNFIPILDALIDAHRSGSLGLGEALHVEETGEAIELNAACSEVHSLMEARASIHGGWGRQTIVRGAPSRYARLRALARNDEANTIAALTTANAYVGLLDEIGGGIFLETTDAEWTQILYEKRTRQESDAMHVFLDAYEQTGDDAWLTRVAVIARHLTATMQRADGAFYTYQEDHAPGWRDRTTIADYFALSASERLEYGTPPVDRAVYTDVNADVIAAFARWSEVTGEAAALEIAARAARALLEERQQEEGWMLHVSVDAEVRDDNRMVEVVERPVPHLRSQVRFGVALLALARVSGERVWIEAAERIAEALEALADTHGYFSSVDDGTGELLGRERSVRENAIAARFLRELAIYTHDSRWAERADAVVTHLLPADPSSLGMHALGEAALSIEQASLSALQITIVGDTDAPESRALYQASLRFPEPYKTIQYQVHGQYPEADEPVAYVCTAAACSRPVSEASELAAAAVRLQQVQGANECGGR